MVFYGEDRTHLEAPLTAGCGDVEEQELVELPHRGSASVQLPRAKWPGISASPSASERLGCLPIAFASPLLAEDDDQELVSAPAHRALTSEFSTVPLAASPPIQVVLQCYSEVFAQVASYSDDHRSFFREARTWSRAFRDSAQEDVGAADAYQELMRTAHWARTILRSDRNRGLRLLLCAGWITLLGFVCPLLSLIWMLADNTADLHEEHLASHRRKLGWLAVSSLVIAALIPTRVQQESTILGAVGRFGGETRAENCHEELEAAGLTITASREFVMFMKFSLCACSSIGLIITFSPLLGAMIACAGLLAHSLSEAHYVRVDLKLSMLGLCPPAAREVALFSRGASALEGLSREAVAIHERYQMGVVRTLSSTCFFVVAARSLFLWVCLLEGCGQAERDTHDAACLPSIVAMLCPGFLTVGTLFRFLLGLITCCDEGEGCVHETGGVGRCCYGLSSSLLCTPTVGLHALGMYLALRFLTDVAKSPLVEVLALWRVPAWEEALVLSGIFSLWVSMLILSSVIVACFRILRNTGWPLFFGIYAVGCQMMEVFLTSVTLSHGGETFLPKLLVTASAVSTAILSLLGVGYILHFVIRFLCVKLRDRPTVGYGYLWG